MPSRRDLLAALGAGAALGVAGCAGRDCTPVDPAGLDWPQPGGDAGNTAAAPDQSLPARVGERWRASIAPEGDLLAFAGAAVSDGLVVTAGRTSDGGFHGSVGLRDGDSGPWYPTPRTIAAPPVVAEGRSPSGRGASLDDTDGYTVLVNQTDAGSELRVLDNGVEEWTRSLDGSGPPAPRAVEGTLFGGDASSAFAVDTASGEERWRRAFGDDRGGGAVSFPPVVDDDAAYVAVTSSSDRGIYALDRSTGAVEWSIEGLRAYRAPARIGSLLLVPAAYELLAFDAAAGDRRWATSTPADRRTFRPPSGTGETLAASDGTAVHGIDPETGALSWGVDYETVGRPIVVGDAAVVDTESGVVAHELGDGSERWRLEDVSLLAPLGNGVLVRRADELVACTACEN